MQIIGKVRKSKLIFLTLNIILALVLSSCSSQSEKPVDKQGFFMGTVITEKVYGKNAEKAAAEVMDKMSWIEKNMTINEEGSEIDKLNALAGKDKAVLSKDSVYVMGIAQKYSELSQGAFDITVGPLVKAWGIFTDHARIPSPEEINNLKKLVDYKSLVIDEKSSSAALKKEGQVVDLGGIGKGYAGDAAIQIFKNNGVKSAFVNLGGNVVVLGTKPDGGLWKIGVQNPRAENGRYIGILSVKDKAIVSSGDYERYFEKDGKRYHHILDPKTGYPADSGLIGTTIIADKSTDADALSTATFVLGLEKGMKLVESLDGVEAIFITNDKKVYTTSGLKSVFTFDDESKEFQYVEKR